MRGKSYRTASAGSQTRGSTYARTTNSVGAAREERCQHHQIGKRKQPLFRLCSGCFRGSRDDAQMAAACEVVQMFDADARQAGHFRIGKDLLT